MIMDMDTMMMESIEDEFKNMQDLLAKYQNDIFELKAGTGAAMGMSKEEIWKAEDVLEEKIVKLVDDILRYEKTYSFVL